MPVGFPLRDELTGAAELRCHDAQRQTSHEPAIAQVANRLLELEPGTPSRLGNGAASRSHFVGRYRRVITSRLSPPCWLSVTNRGLVTAGVANQGA